MKLAIIGATGFIGSAIVNEALDRGHQVTAIARQTEKLSARKNLSRVNADIFNTDSLSDLLADHDAVISGFASFQPEINIEEAKKRQVTGIANIIEASKKAGVERLLVVGGAGSLKVSTGEDLVDTKKFPAEWKENALATREALHLLREEKNLKWTFLSPSALIKPGKRTAKFRLGLDELLIDDSGNSHISTEDYAVAMINEAENPAHIQQRFTVGY